MADPYRYFRIEARELIDELSAGIAALQRGESTSAQVGGLLRHAHTLKGAARVVSQPEIADHTHALEGLLEPFRNSTDLVSAEQLDEMLGQVDEIGDLLRSLDVEAPAVSAVPAPRTEPILEPRPDVVRTARASLIEIDAVIDGVGRSRTQLNALRECLEQGARLSERADVGDELRDALEGRQRKLGIVADRIERDLREVHDVAERLRLVPVTSIVSDLEGAARDVAAAQGKRVQVEVGGGQLRLDAPVLAGVQDALRQIVRNAVAHGIEEPADRVAAGKPARGRIRVEVSQRAGQVVFSCADDGRGVDLDAVRRMLRRAHPDQGALDDRQVLDLLALGGVSTATTVTEVSGRGIGLDVVRETAIQLGGSVAIRTRPGAGTTIDLTTPLSLSAQEVLFLDDDTVTAVRLTAVLETARVRADDITAGLGGEVLRHAGQELPFLPLAAAFGNDTCTARSRPAWSVLILTGRSGRVAIGVRRLIGTGTIAVRPLPRLAPVAPLISGIWLDVDAQPRLVLDPEELAGATDRRVAAAPAPEPLAPILIVDDSLTTRMLEQSILESAGYRVELAASAEEGLAMAAGKRYALALVDVEMPGMNGFEFVEQTRTRTELRHMACILVTSRASAEDRQRGVAVGARAHIDKREFQQGTLLDRICELLGG
jgi:two-component system chemotaxis sensor kinase CheA